MKSAGNRLQNKFAHHSLRRKTTSLFEISLQMWNSNSVFWILHQRLPLSTKSWTTGQSNGNFTRNHHSAGSERRTCPILKLTRFFAHLIKTLWPTRRKKSSRMFVIARSASRKKDWRMDMELSSNGRRTKKSPVASSLKIQVFTKLWSKIFKIESLILKPWSSYVKAFVHNVRIWKMEPMQLARKLTWWCKLALGFPAKRSKCDSQEWKIFLFKFCH